MPQATWDVIPPEAQAVVAGGIVAFEARIAGLEARLNQNSSNSSRPPSSDGPQVKRGVPRPPSGRRRGGQKGRHKHERVILPPDEVVDHKPGRCEHCDAPWPATIPNRSSIR